MSLLRLCCATLVALALASTAFAQATPSEPRPTPEYREVIAAAVAEHQAAHYEEARALYLRAHALFPNARTERALGMVAYELRDYVGAYRYLRDALADPRNPLEGQMRTDAEHLQALADARLGRVRVTGSADPSVRIDGEPASFEPDGTVLLGLGSHRVEIRRADGEWIASRVEIVGSDAHTIETPAAPAVATVDEADETPSDEIAVSLTSPVAQADTGSGDVTNEWWFWTLISVAIAGGIAGGVAGGVLSQDPGTVAPYPGTTGVIMTLTVAP